ncbi:E3 ubiquitin-protein ligase PUB23 [Coffea arabica]|uniref:U-box domain-containing protein n=1 Tax=Coffea arabica TaxID=13443 RepID=A0A6P6WEJ5_COFAR|nr:E3 ubiquitin-protein ligase PUB23-like [Coffea arabica]
MEKCSHLHNSDPNMDFPQHFRCPISMELMKDPVTICTGVTYERKNIEKWFNSYKKNTCPATMQCIDSFEMTPNHTLKRLIQAWQQNGKSKSCIPSSPAQAAKHEELISLLKTIESTPFKVSPLKKLKSVVEIGDEIKLDFKKSGGVELLVKIVVQILVECCSDFVAFRACEEAIGVLDQLPLSDEEEDCQTLQLLMKPECIKSFTIMLQRGSAEARFCIVSIFQKMARADFHWNHAIKDEGIDFFKSLLEIVSDEMCTRASSCALQVLIDILDASKKSRLQAIEAGALCTLIDLLPDSNKSKCEKIMLLIKLLCECAEGRLAFIEHGLGIAAISKKMLNVSTAATKIGVKILWLICFSHPTENVLEEMLMFGSVKKLVALLHIGGSSTTKARVIKIFKYHGNTWKRYPCFPSDIKDYLGLGYDI